MSPRTSTRKRTKHAPRFTMKVPQHEGSLNVYYVHDCSCGWKSPLCPTAERAGGSLRPTPGSSVRPALEVSVYGVPQPAGRET